MPVIVPRHVLPPVTLSGTALFRRICPHAKVSMQPFTSSRKVALDASGEGTNSWS